jgi:hypothetical protein
MEATNSSSPGFTLVASLLLLLLMTGISIGLLMMVQTEGRAGNNDVENSMAYRGAEGAIENMTSTLAATFQNIQAPKASDITSLSSQAPTIPGITFPSGGYTLTPRTNSDGSLKTTYGLIGGGPNQGLYAQILPIDLVVIAQRPLGDQVRMLRTVEIALIPVFQFGAFSDSDLALFSSPDLGFYGRIHTNGDLYLGVATSNTVTFHDKITAYGNVIRNQLPNGLAPSSSYNNDGTVNIPFASGGCDTPPTTPTACRAIGMGEASVLTGPASAQNSNVWPNLSKSIYNGFIRDGNYGNMYGTGVNKLTLPFVGGGAQSYEIIRRPIAGEPSSIGLSRLANQAQIRVLLSDQKADLHMPDWNGDTTQDIPLDNTTAGSVFTGNGVPVPGVLAVGGDSNTYFAAATKLAYINPVTHNAVKFDTNFVPPPGGPTPWPLIGGWLLVEVQHSDGHWYGVTQEWLRLGFARGLLPPASSVTPVAVHPNAILMFQMLADRAGDGTISGSAESSAVGGSDAQFNWFPINFYDAREGEVRDWVSGTAPGGAASCSPNGVFNAVELDVANLRKWLKGNLGTTGNQVDSVSQNGYVLYFSDRRGMQADPLGTPSVITGAYGFEDVINTSSGISGNPDGVAEPNVTVAGVSRSPEDLDNNGRVDKYGATNVGNGFGINTNTTPPDPFTTRISTCFTTGRKNRVSGARHALKLVDGSLGNLPTKPDNTGGFTVASENPVYIQGDYNSSSADPTWPAGSTAAEPAHAAAAVIADTVTLLSNQWQDAGVNGASTKVGSLLYPTDATKYRPAVSTYYRAAVAAGKTLTFPHPSFDPTAYFGTDGGLHNFLRFLENWNGDTLNYKGSLVSLYYATYNTGTFKCCNYVVYQPPTRNYKFDPLFAQPQNLPPGTPMFRDIDNLTYRQDFTPY